MLPKQQRPTVIPSIPCIKHVALTSDMSLSMGKYGPFVLCRRDDRSFLCHLLWESCHWGSGGDQLWLPCTCHKVILAGIDLFSGLRILSCRAAALYSYTNVAQHTPVAPQAGRVVLQVRRPPQGLRWSQLCAGSVEDFGTCAGLANPVLGNGRPGNPDMHCDWAHGCGASAVPPQKGEQPSAGYASTSAVCTIRMITDALGTL